MKNFIISMVVVLSATFSTVSADDWFLRIGAANVSPNDSSGEVLGDDGVSVGSDTEFAFTLTYMFNKEWGIELLGANPFRHKLTGTGELAGLPIGTTKHLPPTLNLLYNFGDDDVKYHVGAGINYTKFFEDYASPELNAALESSVDLDLSSSVGLSLKAGFDIPISDDWYFSGGIFYLMLDTDADVIVNDTVATTVDVDIDPWVVMLGVSTSF